MMNRDSNKYTFLFSIVMIVVVAGALAFTATSLKERQSINVSNEKMQNILATVGIEVERDEASESFSKYVTEQISLDNNSKISSNVKAFDIDLAKELKKPVSEQHFPLYIVQADQNNYYVIPIRGVGLWGPIWGYICLKSDLNTIKGVKFDHQGETSGLGGEIIQPWFQAEFAGETIFYNDKFVGITVLKGNNDPQGNDKNDHEVDAISGATITGDGVTDMIKERLSHYLKYFKTLQSTEN